MSQIEGVLPIVGTRLAVIGGGTMGAGIAQISALAGYQVSLCEADPERVELSRQRVVSGLARSVERGKATDVERQAASDRLSYGSAIADAIADAAIVIEAIPESLTAKCELFAQLGREAPADALLATNTSALSVAAIARASEQPGRVVGTHFFNPVPAMKLVEIVVHEDIDERYLARARALAEALGKTSIVVRDVPGFASSRLGIALGLEAMRMVEAGVASAADIDTAMKLGYRHPMGPLELTDLVGLDVRLHIAEHLAEALGPRFSPPQILRDKVAAGALGKKSGQGFYRWSDGRPRAS